MITVMDLFAVIALVSGLALLVMIGHAVWAALYGDIKWFDDVLEEEMITDARKAARYEALVDTIEGMHDTIMTLTQAIRQTLAENGHLADGENCTLYALKAALRRLEEGET